MNEAIIGKFKALVDAYRALKGPFRITGLSPDGFEGDVHLSIDILCKEFPNFTVSSRGGGTKYPWLLFAEADGIRFYALATNEEYETMNMPEQTEMQWIIQEIESAALPPLAVGYNKQGVFVAVAYCYTETQAQFIWDSFDAQGTPEGLEMWKAKLIE